MLEATVVRKVVSKLDALAPAVAAAPGEAEMLVVGRSKVLAAG